MKSGIDWVKVIFFAWDEKIVLLLAYFFHVKVASGFHCLIVVSVIIHISFVKSISLKILSCKRSSKHTSNHFTLHL